MIKLVVNPYMALTFKKRLNRDAQVTFKISGSSPLHNNPSITKVNMK